MAFPEYTPTLSALAKTLAERFGDRELIVTPSERLTYAQAEARSSELARALLAAGAGKGTRVGLLMSNRPDWVVAWLAASRIGALVVPISTFYPARELGWVLRHADVQHLLMQPGLLRHDYLASLEQVAPSLGGQDAGDGETPAPLFAPELPHLRHVWVWDGSDRRWARSDRDLLALAPRLDDAYLEEVEDCVTPADGAVVIYSSGSTAEPKGAIHTQGTLVRHAHNLDQYRDFEAGDRIYLSMPFFWVGGLVTGLLATVQRGACCLCEDAFEAEATLEFLSRERATSIGGWPAQMQALAEHPRLHEYDWSSVRSGSLYAVLPPEQVPADPELRCNSLGMTESCGPHTWGDMNVDLPEELRGTFGQPVPGVEHKIVDPDSGETLPPGELGEICVRGYSRMQGLYKREREQVFDPDGFYRTGDSGYFNADGHLFFKGRLGEMIKTAGANVSPREVETVLQSFDEIELAAVLGLPDPVRGELVVAAVVPSDGQAFDEAALREKLRAQLSSYKVPKRIVPLATADLPLTDSGKVHKQQLRERLLDRGGGAS